MLDLLLVNGTVVDGMGVEGFSAAVGIDGEEIVLFRGASAAPKAARTIDAQGHVICPGFIDMHAHSGLVILADPQHEPKLLQGVTTEVIGVDGNSYAPFVRPADLDDFVTLNAGLDGRPPPTAKWSTVAEYLDLFDKKVAVNVAYVVGNTPLRVNAVGWDEVAATEPQIRDMQAMLREAMEEGAFGFSTGLDYPPGSYADTHELVQLGAQAAALGGIYHTHVRYSLGDRFLDPFREAITIGRRSGVAIHITHFYQRLPVIGAAADMLRLIETASDEGLDITFDSYPYPLSSSRLLIVVPQWAHNGGPRQLMKVLASVDARARLRAEMRPRGPSWQDMYLTNFARARNHHLEGRSVAEIAVLIGRSEADTICDLLLDEDLGLTYVSANGNASTLPKFVAHPLSMVGSDAILLGAFPSPRTYGTFPVILGDFVRMEGFIRLPEAIRKMTYAPARRLGLKDRGVVRDGMKADLVVFDPTTVGSSATRQVPKTFPVGIEYVIVNGRLAVEHGRSTGIAAGRALHRGR